MTQDEIIEMARQAGLSLASDRPYDLHGLQSQLFEFAKLVDAKATAKEREACAKVCDSEKKWWNGMSHSENDIYQAIDNISACIQARGEA